MRIEYLVITKQDGSFCDNIDTFKNLLKVNSHISITGKQLTYQSSDYEITVDYEVQTDEVKGKNQRFFHIELNYHQDEEIDDTKIEQFNSLTKIN